MISGEQGTGEVARADVIFGTKVYLSSAGGVIMEGLGQ